MMTRARAKKAGQEDLFAPATPPPGTTRHCVVSCSGAWLEHTVRSPVAEYVYDKWGEGEDGRRSPGAPFFCPEHRAPGRLIEFVFLGEEVPDEH